jgi:hypothetical protein
MPYKKLSAHTLNLGRPKLVVMDHKLDLVEDLVQEFFSLE